MRTQKANRRQTIFETRRWRRGVTCLVSLLAIILSCAVWGEAADAQVFIPLDNLPASETSEALAISDNGVVVGRSLHGENSTDAVRWTSTGNIESLGTGQAVDVSGDGSVIVGCLGCDASGQGGGPVAWSNGNADAILQGEGLSYANGVSSDGVVVVGHNAVGKALRWTEATGTVVTDFLQGGLLGGGVFIRADGASEDGAVVVGEGRTASGPTAVRWTDDLGAFSIGDLDGGDFSSRATAVSADGSVVVGTGTSEAGEQAFRWTSAGGITALGILPGIDFLSEAFDVSADGSLIVGAAASGPGPADRVAFIWDSEHGTRILQEVLVNSYNLDLTGWQLTEATGISSDGQTIVGNGSQGAWMARLFDKLNSDFDWDGDVDGDDLGVWQQKFGTMSGTPTEMGDADGDGDVDGGDFLIVQREFGIDTGLGGGSSGLDGLSAGVPEPSTLGLIAFASLALLAPSRRTAHFDRVANA